jgi:ABC-2 type transport system permease protein
MLGLLCLFPVLAGLVADPHWQRHLRQAGPLTAGPAVQTTTASRPRTACRAASGQQPGPGVLGARAAAALLGAAAMLRPRDA